MQPLQLDPAHIRAIRDFLNELERAALNPEDLQPGDIAQIRPDACPHWGGSVLRICRVDKGQASGYVLVAHRGASRHTWQTYGLSQLKRLAPLHYAEPDMATRPYTAGLREQNLPPFEKRPAQRAPNAQEKRARRTAS